MATKVASVFIARLQTHNRVERSRRHFFRFERRAVMIKQNVSLQVKEYRIIALGKISWQCLNFKCPFLKSLRRASCSVRSRRRHPIIMGAFICTGCEWIPKRSEWGEKSARAFWCLPLFGSALYRFRVPPAH